MRTTIDLPDALVTRAKHVMAERHLTLRALVIDGLERVLAEEPVEFRLRDASVGYDAAAEGGVSSTDINRAIDRGREREECP